MMLDDYTKTQVTAICEVALVNGDAIGVFPTPLDELASAAGTLDIVDIGDLPDDLVAAKPRRLRRLLGAVDFREKTIFVDSSQRSSGRVLWTKGHEVAHFILPWHQAGAHLDDDNRLYGDSAEVLEVEANFGAAHLIFQGYRSLTNVLDYQHGLAAAMSLAELTGSSYHAAIRYYLEHHPNPMALAVTGRAHNGDHHFPIYRVACSKSWMPEFGPPEWSFGRRLNVRDGTFAGLMTGQAQGSIWKQEDLFVTQAGDTRHVQCEMFDNGHTRFYLLQLKKRIRLGRRVTVLSG